jgi:hypothetical protein
MQILVKEVRVRVTALWRSRIDRYELLRGFVRAASQALYVFFDNPIDFDTTGQLSVFWSVEAILGSENCTPTLVRMVADPITLP